MKSRIAVFVTVIQVTLFFGHWVVYQTLVSFFPVADSRLRSELQISLAVLSVCFITASLLAWRYYNLLLRAFYTVAAIWMGFLNFGFMAACLCWLVWGTARIAGFHPDRTLIATTLFGVGLVLSLYGLVNAAMTRVTRVSVKLANLPESWRGRVVALFSDVHLGHVHGAGFLRRIVSMVMREHPDLVLIAGDLYDGTAVDLKKCAEPLRGLSAPHGVYFSAGNHEEFTDPTKYLNAVAGTGVRVLNNEKVVSDGLQIVGIHYRDSVNDDHFRRMIRHAALDRGQASILLTHAPDRVRISAEEGFSLQVSGHTHGGQIFPFTWPASRLYGKFVYGLQHIGDFFVYTSYGAGTWGPPLRVGTKPEIVMIRFE